MRVLELFKGTGSVGKAIRALYPDCEIISLDILEKYNPTHCCDIMDFDYKQYPVGHFDIIWASPECKVFSVAQYRLMGRNWRDMEHLKQVRRDNEKYVLRTVEIIEYLKPSWWFVENPFFSAMKDIEKMKSLPSYRFDYCQFGYSYKKPTRIWTNRTFNDVVCSCNGKHSGRIGGKEERNKEEHKTREDARYSIPPALLAKLLSPPDV